MNRASFFDELVKLGTARILRKVATEAPNTDQSALPFAIFLDPADASTRLPNSDGPGVVQPRLGTVEIPREYIDSQLFNRVRWSA